MTANKQESDEKIRKFTEKLKIMLAAITDHMQILKSSPTQKYLPETPEPTTVVPSNRKNPPLGGGQSTKLATSRL